MAQVVERYLGVVEAVGSSPATQTSKKNSAFAEFFFYILIVGLEPYEGKKR